MGTDQKQSLRKSAVKAMFLVSAFAVGAFSQSLDTAKVPVIVNAAASVSIQPPDGSAGVGATRTLTANKTDTLIIRLPKTLSVSQNSRMRANVPSVISSSAGRVSLSLPVASYKNAAIALYAVDGKRIMHGKASATAASNVISRPKVAAGAYLLSVDGASGNSFTARHTHGGGSLNINVAFQNEGTAPGGQLKKEANSLASEWTITASATGYATETRTFTPVPGVNPLQTITLQMGIVPLGCNRESLTASVDAYLAALETGDYTKMPLAANAKYFENDHDAKQTYSGGKMTYDKAVAFGDGLWKTKIIPDFHRNLIDVQECATFTEIIVADTAKGKNSKQYVIGARLKVADAKISEVSLVVTQAGDWGFNAKTYLSASSSKKEDTVWAKPGLIPREELRAAAYAYFAYFGDKTVDVPWGIPCTRVEGGMSTGDSPTSSCNVGVPDQKIDPKGITYLADPDYGMVVLFLYFGGADSHAFKILPNPTRYRYIHTLTAMKQSDFQP